MIGLVGCAQRKIARAAPARELYDSALFRKSLRYAEARCDRVFVLSAKHGLLDLDKVIEPYDSSLAQMSATGRSRWGRGVVDSLLARGLVADQLLVMAGSQYVEPVDGALRTLGLQLGLSYPPIVDPMAGMMIGERLKFLGDEFKVEVRR